MMRPAVRGETPAYLSSCRAARVLGVSKRTLLNWVNAGLVPKPEVNPTNGYLLWTTADIEGARMARMEERSDSTGHR
jgi:DNA-binding transcriptional MerR regulator